MSAPPYMKLFWGDYHKSTRHLTRGQHGAYLLLIGEAWRLGGSLPDDDKLLAAWALCTPEEWEGTKATIMAFFTLRRGKWVHDRVREELACYESTSRKRKEAGRRGGKATNGNHSGNPEAIAYQEEGNSRHNQNQNHISNSVPIGTDGHGPSQSDDEIIAAMMGSEVRKRAWDLLRKAMVEREGLDKALVGKFIGKLASDHALTPEELWQIAEHTWRSHTLDSRSYVVKSAQNIVMRRGVVGIDAPSERQQIAWMEDWVESPARWKTHERGPKPGCDGCRVSVEIQARFGVSPPASNVIPLADTMERKSA